MTTFELLIPFCGYNITRDEKPDMCVVPKDWYWSIFDAPVISIKETAPNLSVPPVPDYVPEDFPRPFTGDYQKGSSGSRPTRSTLSPGNKKKKLPGKPRRKSERVPSSDEYDLWSSKVESPSASLVPEEPHPCMKDVVVLDDPNDWILELGSSKSPPVPDLSIVCKSDDIPYYGNQLYDLDHNNYVGIPEDGLDSPIGPIVVSVEQKTKSRQQDKLKCMIRTIEGTRRLWIPGNTAFAKQSKVLFPEYGNVRWTKVKTQEIKNDLLNMEERSIAEKFKFGVLYAVDDQDENQIFNTMHDETSKDFNEFLSVLGEMIELQGWQGYRGGLDVKTNTTGLHAYYTKIKKYEVIFHVSTLLPKFSSDSQQVERKRHIGNDVVVIIFHEGEKPFNLSAISSQFTRVVVVVKKEKSSEDNRPCYKVAIANRPGISNYTPSMPHPPIFECNTSFREFFLTKCINAERSALRAVDFRSKMNRAQGEFLKNLVETYCKTKK
eukprot:TRINITY_DN7591_c0_g1_i1.p1 TRINITY_DN7591_c0_g1~~TRINITY_DN7591_c0_g1_i1.p1  ORF type:complete len:492 (-),score=98.25 TRINITY_DN7591_c0_g1_i1:5-1480(-)